MPRASLNEAQIAETREKILDTAAQIINDEGFQALFHAEDRGQGRDDGGQYLQLLCGKG